MRKKQPPTNPGQALLALGAQFPEATDGMLKDGDRDVAQAVARILKEDDRPRIEMAASVSAILGADVSKAMLDAYASEARNTHNISLGRFLALVAVTRRYDVLDELLHKIGAKIVVGEELIHLELGLLEAERVHQRRRGSNLRRLLASVETGGRQ
jgi:hypothetical protein